MTSNCDTCDRPDCPTLTATLAALRAELDEDALSIRMLDPSARRRHRATCALLDVAEAARAIQLAAEDARFDVDSDLAYSRLFAALAALDAAAGGTDAKS